MSVTREQFIRGFSAIQAANDRRMAMNVAAREAGFEDFDLGTDPVVYELHRQLEERCNDRDDPVVGTAITYALYEGHIVRPAAGAEQFRMNTAEAVWRWWQETATGPFLKEASA